MTQFPFDRQTCKLTFCSWKYNGDEVNLEFADGFAAVNTEYYIQNTEWDLASTAAYQNLEYKKWPDLTFYFFLRRRPGFYIYVLILPSLLLSLLTPLLFWIPPCRPDRMTLG
jgi:hypothetical protein